MDVLVALVLGCKSDLIFFHISQRVTVCGTCLVGEFVPVYRWSKQRWQFGQVVSFCDSKVAQQFGFAFGSGKTEHEWLDLHPYPFDAYVISYNSKQAAKEVYSKMIHGMSECSNEVTSNTLTKYENARHGSQGNGVPSSTFPTYAAPLVPIAQPPFPQQAFQSLWSVPYNLQDCVTPDRCRLSGLHSVVSPRLWTIDVRSFIIPGGRANIKWAHWCLVLLAMANRKIAICSMLCSITTHHCDGPELRNLCQAARASSAASATLIT